MRREWFWLEKTVDGMRYVHNLSGGWLLRPHCVKDVEWSEARGTFFRIWPNADRIRRRRVPGSSMRIDFMPRGSTPLFPYGTRFKAIGPTGSLTGRVEGQQLVLPCCDEVPSYLLEGGEVMKWCSRVEGWMVGEAGPIYLKDVIPPKVLRRAA